MAVSADTCLLWSLSEHPTEATFRGCAKYRTDLVSDLTDCLNRIWKKKQHNPSMLNLDEIVSQMHAIIQQMLPSVMLLPSNAAKQRLPSKRELLIFPE